MNEKVNKLPPFFSDFPAGFSPPQIAIVDPFRSLDAYAVRGTRG